METERHIRMVSMGSDIEKYGLEEKRRDMLG